MWRPPRRWRQGRPKRPARAAAFVHRLAGGSRESGEDAGRAGSYGGELAMGRERGAADLFEVVLFPITVKQVVRVERDDPAIGVGDVHAGFLHAADIEVPGVEEL